MYPKYPAPKRQVLDIDLTQELKTFHYPKDNLGKLVQFYDELTSLGIYILPKNRKYKSPYKDFWEKDKQTGIASHCDRDTAITTQKTRTDVSGWVAVTGVNRLFVVDLDPYKIKEHGRDPQEVYEFIQAKGETGFVFATPSGGVHLYYRLTDEQRMLGSIATPIRGVDTRGEGGLVVTLGGYNVYLGKDATDHGVEHCHYGTYEKIDGGDYSHIPTMSDELYNWLKSKKQLIKESKGETYGRTFQGKERVETHEAKDDTSQERIVLECLAYILQHWEMRSYEEWMQLWMSAYAGSNGSTKIRDFIANHNDLNWSDGEIGRNKFINAWNNHSPEEEGYTVASLFYIAKQAGWLTKTGYEVPDSITEKINVPIVQQWLDGLEVMPKRLHLISQTGSGKTFAFMRLWERLNRPKSVLFVPSKKLAYELAGTLLAGGLPVTVYLDEKGKPKSGDVLKKAAILVTTLQTFATKVFNINKGMSDYGLVYIEECDQLIQQFARGGNGKSQYETHVTHIEATEGFAVLRSCYADSEYVWAVDATMSMVTVELAKALCPYDNPPLFVKNDWVQPKAAVTMLNNIGEALYEILEALFHDKRVVVAADTETQAHDVDMILQILKGNGFLLDKKSIVITSKTAHKEEVLEFFKNVNESAKEYDLVIYNSAMSSGVSITSERPGVVVQICKFLTPRVNLQMLNRYRKQDKVFVFYANIENIYGKSAEDVIIDIQDRINIESAAVNVPVATRTSDAELRTRLTALSVGDELQQKRAPREMYRGLLIEDGRDVIWGDLTIVPQYVDEARQKVKEYNAAFKEHIAKTWDQTPPIDSNNPVPDDYTYEQYAQGARHAHISYALNGNIPRDVAPEVVSDIVDTFYKHLPALLAYIDKEGTMRKGEHILSNRDISLASIVNHVTLVKLLGVLGIMYRSLDEVLTEEVIEARCDWFMEKLYALRAEYNKVTIRTDQQFDAVYKRKDNNKERAVDFTKILLKHIGLNQVRGRGPKKNKKETSTYYIGNYQEAIKFLEWRNAHIPAANKKVLTVTHIARPAMIVTKENYKELYKNLSAQDQFDVDMMLKNDVCETKLEAMILLAERRNAQKAV